MIDYGEPFRAGDPDYGVIYNARGQDMLLGMWDEAEAEERAFMIHTATCLNELAGVPDDTLPGYVTRLEASLVSVRSMTALILSTHPEDRKTIDAIRDIIDGMLAERGG